MKFDSADEISRWLEHSGGLSEALMTELRLIDFGYSVHVEFRPVIDASGHVLDDPLDVGFDLHGVQRLILEGGLSARMLDSPEEINWGLSEVAVVRVGSSGDGVTFEALWEGARRLEIHCVKANLSLPTNRL